jgi:hypothetical protein
MKTKLIITIAILAIGISSCKKNEDNNPTTTKCKLSSFTGGDNDRYDITYNGSLITNLNQVSGSPLDKQTLFYNSDSLLTHRYTYDNTTNKLTDVDTFYYDASKKLTTHFWYSVNNSGVRSFENKITYNYNSSNQIENYRDSFFNVFSTVTVYSYDYINNRISKETSKEYNDGIYLGKQEATYSYTTTTNNIKTVLKQPTLVLNSHPIFIAEFANTDLLVSQMEEKYYDETNTLIDTYTRIFSYTFDNGKLASVGDNDSGIFIRFGYKCE